MRPISLLALGALLPAALPAAPPQVIELYQSQGCSSCPPANAVLSTIADRPDIIALNFAVTYWDRLGWKDSFAQPAFTRRQWDYANAAHRPQVSTPQMIVNGTGAIVGRNPLEVEAAVRRYARAPNEPAIAASGNGVTVGAAAGARAGTVWLVRYDPRVLQVPVRAGENGGRTLPHRNIVRDLIALGRWNGAAARFALPKPAANGLRSAILVQQGVGGPILAAARL